MDNVVWNTLLSLLEPTYTTDLNPFHLQQDFNPGQRTLLIPMVLVG